MLSEVTNKIKPFLVMEILDKAKQLEAGGADVIHLEIGEPDFKTPEIAVKKAVEAIEAGFTGYTHSLGLIELREAIAKHYHQKYGVEINADQVIVSSGTSPILLLTLATIINPGDEIILTDPTYACYCNFITLLKGVCRYAKLDPEDGFTFNSSLIKKAITSKTKAILINSPSNPTGLIIGKEQLQELASFGIEVISDEIYHGLEYEEKAHSMLEFSDNVVAINGFSKLYAMPGWRVGFAITSPERIRAMQKMQQNFFISASNFGQQAALTALQHADEYLPAMINTYNERRKLLLDRLPKLGLEVRGNPSGAFYILADARKFCKSSYDFAFELLEKTNVAITPGIDFGQQAEGFIRFSYANSIEKIEEALDRLEKYLG